ncbi:uncharacterized protein LOC117168487 [Belonocnema kinseyi]|uniref:uncharacterized protein LOC117168487 n=1 Tax=Belonocnema kinseyi TaxID=2817044 RepID=UPI00143D68E8|nr:uncharacterized protein LOC117168487 [Belonocnema kinseyi]
MKHPISLFFLFITYFSGKILGDVPDDGDVLSIPHPSEIVISKSYKSDCHLKDDDKELYALWRYSVGLASDVWNADNRKLNLKYSKKLKCLKDDKLRSMVEKLMKNMCDSKAPQSTIVKDIVAETCNSFVLAILKTWNRNHGVRMNKKTLPY